MADSVSEAVGDVVKAAVEALSLTGLRGVVKRKLPTVPEGDTIGLPQVVVSVGEEQETERLTAIHKKRTIRFAVTIVTAGGQQTGDNAAVRAWRDRIDDAIFDRQLTIFAALTNFVNLRAFGGKVFDPEALNKDFNYSALSYELKCVETLALTA